MPRVWFYMAIAGAVAIVLGMGAGIILTLPPRTLVMATGAPGGAYYETGLRYREIWAKEGVDLQLLPTDGAIENLARLRDPGSGVSAGFIQGGTTTRSESPQIESLGTIFYEPLWFFSRLDGSRTEGLSNSRLSIGPEGSGSRALGLKLLEKNGINAKLFDFTPRVVGEKLIAGEIDFAFIVASWDAPVIQRLVVTEGIHLRSPPRADAYTGLFPYLDKLVLPAGVGDLARNLPPADVTLVAPKASLAVHTNLHPAIQYLLLNAAVQVHSGPGVFRKAGQFPAAESIDLPLSEEALRYYKAGRPFLLEHLPFWIATLAGRLLVIFVPLAVLVYPFFKFLPEIYDWAMKSKIEQLYDETRAIERETEVQGAQPHATELIAKLDQLDQRANHLQMPKSYASMLYMLRAHTDLVRERLAINPGRRST